MIYLYTAQNNDRGRVLEETLRELVVAYEVKFLDGAGERMPYLQEGRNVYRTREEITTFLDELARELRVSRAMQSDACFIDPETGETC